MTFTQKYIQSKQRRYVIIQWIINLWNLLPQVDISTDGFERVLDHVMEMKSSLYQYQSKAMAGWNPHFPRQRVSEY